MRNTTQSLKQSKCKQHLVSELAEEIEVAIAVNSTSPAAQYITQHSYRIERCFEQTAHAMSEVSYVLLQLLIWHLLRSLACATQRSCSAMYSLHTLRWLPTACAVCITF